MLYNTLSLSLEPRDRTLLRLHRVKRSSIDDIAALYRVHRATAASWIQVAREALVATTRSNFMSATQLEAHDEAWLASASRVPVRVRALASWRPRG